MTKYSVQIHDKTGWESVALFADSVSEDAMIAFAEVQYQLGNSLTLPCDNIAILDMDNGEIVWDWKNAHPETEEGFPGQMSLEDVYPNENIFSRY